MIYRMKFGDAYGDGHREYVQIWVSVLSEKCIDAARFSIKAQWGNDFFDGFACEAEDAWLSDTVWEALYEADYPVDSIYQYCDVEEDLSAEAHHDLLAFKNECTDTYLSIDEDAVLIFTPTLLTALVTTKSKLSESFLP